MSLNIILAVFAPAAVAGIVLLVAASFIASHIVKVVRESAGAINSSPLSTVNNFLDFAKVAEAYVDKTGDTFRIRIVYVLSTAGASVFVFSVLGILQALNLPK